ncbi:MAG: hypothetical protein OXC95_03690 [Dehalococcoidia bacterium]|nr:hypothetical protein [Dehalococcoidia bacterium]
MIERIREHPGTAPLAICCLFGWAAADFQWYGPAMMFGVLGLPWLYNIITGRDIF